MIRNIVSGLLIGFALLFIAPELSALKTAFVVFTVIAIDGIITAFWKIK